MIPFQCQGRGSARPRRQSTRVLSLRLPLGAPRRVLGRVGRHAQLAGPSEEFVPLPLNDIRSLRLAKLGVLVLGDRTSRRQLERCGNEIPLRRADGDPFEVHQQRPGCRAGDVADPGITVHDAIG